MSMSFSAFFSLSSSLSSFSIVWLRPLVLRRPPFLCTLSHLSWLVLFVYFICCLCIFFYNGINNWALCECRGLECMHYMVKYAVREGDLLYLKPTMPWLFCDPNINLIKFHAEGPMNMVYKACVCVCVCPLQAQMHMKNKYLDWNMKMLANEIGHTASAAIKNYVIFPLRSPKISANFAWERGKLHSNGFFSRLLFVLFEKVLTDHSGPFVSCFFSC